jgi:hypothetical protein
VLHSIGVSIRKLARETGGIGCRQQGDTFLLYCPHQDNYEQVLRDFLSETFSEIEESDRVKLRFGVFTDAQLEPDIEERFIRANNAADHVKENPEQLCAFYEFTTN